MKYNGSPFERFAAILVVLSLAALACQMGASEPVSPSQPAAPAETPNVVSQPSATAAAVEPRVEPEPSKTQPVQGGSVSASLQDVKNAVIQIEAQGTFEDPELGLMVNAAGRGSGFIIDPSGLAVTNNHVVTGAALLKVWVGGNQNKVYNAKVVGASECSDLALIDIDGEGFPYLSWRQDEVDVGLEVYAAGFPLGDPEFSLTKGIISKARANGETSWASVDSVIQHDATLNPGNSGGPLVDNRGRVIGINYAGSNESRQYFAIKGQDAQSVIQLLREGKDVESLGINGQAVVSEDGSLSGIWVSSVKSGSPADRTGVQAGDLVMSVENLSLAKDGTMADYCDVLRSHKPGDTLAIDVVRYATQEYLAGQINGRPLKTSFSFANEQEKPTGSGSANAYSGYRMVSDDSHAIELEIPNEWSDVNGVPWKEADQNLGASIAASANLQNFYDGWIEPGVFFGASNHPDKLGGAVGLLDSVKSDFEQKCSYQGRDNFEDSLFSGQYDWFENCEGSGNTFIVLAVVPKSDPNSYVAFMQVQLREQRDFEALDHLITTFNLVGPLP